MTEKEVFNKITSEHKWYIGHYSQGYASQLVSRYNNGQLKQSTIDSFLETFGYYKIKDAEYGQEPYIDPNFEFKVSPSNHDVMQACISQLKDNGFEVGYVDYSQLEGKPSNLKTK